MKSATLQIVLFSLTLGTAFALPSDPIVPTFDTFGATDDTFGGSGIPNGAVASTVLQSGTITLGLTAHQRYDNPALVNDGNGTFTAQAGANIKGPGNLNGALWNFAWDIDVTTLSAGYSFTLLYDFDPGAGTLESDHGQLNLVPGFYDGSENLLFSYLANPILGFIAPPAGSFDPNVNGEYTFALIARGATGGELGRAAIRVNVVGGTSVPDGGATALLLGCGFAGFFFFRKSRA